MSDTEDFKKARELIKKDFLAYVTAASSISVYDEELAIDKSMKYKSATTLLAMYSKLEGIIGKEDPIVVSKDEEDKKIIEAANKDIEAIMSNDKTIPKSNKVLVNKLSPVKR